MTTTNTPATSSLPHGKPAYQMPDYQALVEATETAMRQIASTAREMADDYWNEREEEMRVRKKSEYPKLGLRVQLKWPSLAITWGPVVFIGPRARRRRAIGYIPKGKGFGYSITKLAKEAQPWEMDLVRRTEARMEQFRIDYAELVAIRRRLMSLHKRLSAQEDDHAED